MEELGATTGTQHPVHSHGAPGEVATDELEELQPVVAEALLPFDVLAVLSPVLVVLTLVLAHQAGLRVEEIGHSDEPTVEVVDLSVAQGLGKPGVQEPAHQHAELLG